MMVVLWVTEALPLAVTALIGPVLAVILQVAPARTAFAPFADPIIFLFIGSFMLAEAMFVHGLDRRIAFGALSSRLVGGSPTRILFVYGGVAAGDLDVDQQHRDDGDDVSDRPVDRGAPDRGARVRARQPGLRHGDDADGRVRRLDRRNRHADRHAAEPDRHRHAEPHRRRPDLLLPVDAARRPDRHRCCFASWSSTSMFASLRGLTLDAGAAPKRSTRSCGGWGRCRRGQRNVLVAFGVDRGAVAVARRARDCRPRRHAPSRRDYAAAVPESVAAMVGAILLFLLPVSWRARRFTLTWEQAVRIDWGIILLFGGGLRMGELAFSTGLAEAMGRGITSWLPAQSALSLTLIFTAVAIVMSEAASNTASANMIVPVAIAVAQAAGVNPLQPALGATLGASMGFMMPISTPPNAIVYSSGHVPITPMMRHGIVLDIVGFIVIVIVVSMIGWVL